jgi:hypothetical protein
VTTASMPAPRDTSMRAENKSRVYFDAEGRRQHSRIEVPVDDAGQITAKPFECPRCHRDVPPVWKALNYSKLPVCPVHPGQKMRPHVLRRPQMLPWRQLWDVCEKPLRPVWALPGMAAAGQFVDAANVPTLVMVGAAPAAFEVTRRVWRWGSVRRGVTSGRLSVDPTQDRGIRFAIDAAARKAGYAAAGGTAWLATVAALGLDPATLAGKVAWTLALAPWVPTAATYWHKLREAKKPIVRYQAPTTVKATEPGKAEVDPLEREALAVWRTVLAVRAGEIIGRSGDGTPIKAAAAGKLPGTKLEDWHRVEGGWGATIIGPIGSYESEQFTAAVGRIASAYSAKKSMVTVIPDADDENQALVLVQKKSPIKDARRWAGPDSINMKNGTAPVFTYIDGTKALFELYRPGWGCPHVAVFGTTGSAKSEFLNLLFTIDRWAQHEGRGLVADFLIDPQQGSSFSHFRNDLAAPAACSIEEALMLVRALDREALRRNHYLGHEAKVWDNKRRKWRIGRNWWNPLIDGPILTLTIDEAHDYLANREFAHIVTKAGRMWRKCGIQVRLATHVSLLTDMGGSMALRDMLTGGFVWHGRTANSLSGPTAFNGRINVDCRTIPNEPGMAYVAAGKTPKPMLGRTDWEGGLVPNEHGELEMQALWYDWVRDENDEPIGYPAELPPETLAAFGDEYARWVRYANGEVDSLSPEGGSQLVNSRVAPTEAVFAALGGHHPEPADMDGIVGTLQRNGVSVGVLEVREALAELRADHLVVSVGGKHRLTEHGAVALAEMSAV